MDNFEEELDIPTHRNLKAFYFDFFKDFKEYLSEYYRESVSELVISELQVKENQTLRLFDGHTRGKVIMKNQGDVPCYIHTAKQGGFRLDPGEKIEFYINHEVLITTTKGATIIGFLRF